MGASLPTKSFVSSVNSWFPSRKSGVVKEPKVPLPQSYFLPLSLHSNLDGSDESHAKSTFGSVVVLGTLLSVTVGG